jgi:hypothetical protein
MSSPIGVAIIGSGTLRRNIYKSTRNQKQQKTNTQMNHRHLRQRTTPPSRPSQHRPLPQSNLLPLPNQRAKRLVLSHSHRPVLRRQQTALRTTLSLRHPRRHYRPAHPRAARIHQTSSERRQTRASREADRQRRRHRPRADSVVRQQHRQEQSLLWRC